MFPLIFIFVYVLCSCMWLYNIFLHCLNMVSCVIIYRVFKKRFITFFHTLNRSCVFFSVILFSVVGVI